MIFIFCRKPNTQKITFSGSKQRNENAGHVFLEFILFNNIALEKIRKNILSEAGALKKDFLKLKVARFRPHVSQIR